MLPHIRALLDAELVINATLRPELARSLNSYRFRGQLVAVLPAIYAARERADDFEVRVAAAASSTRGYVITGRSAARITWWPEIQVDDVALGYPRELSPVVGFHFQQRYLPPALVVRRPAGAVTATALTVLDLIPEVGSHSVDEALRRRAVTLDQLWAALARTPHRRGNTLRRDVLTDSRNQPWSPLEREAHRILRAAKIRGWQTNYPVVLDGQTRYLDVAFPQYRIAIELDGYEFHSRRDAFHSDRRRDAALAKLGWIVVRFSSNTVDDLLSVLQSLIAQRRVA